MVEIIRKIIWLALILCLALLTACGSDVPDEAVTPSPTAVAVETADETPIEVTTPTIEVVETAVTLPPDGELVEAESNRDGVFTISAAGERLVLAAPSETFLQVGTGVDVDETGRAILRFADLLTVEVLRDGELTIQEISLDEQAAVVTVLQNGGALLNDFDPGEQVERRFTIETEFATITATGTRFLIARETNSPLEWIIGLDSTENDLQITADGVTKSVPTGTARWVAPIGEPSPGIGAQMGDVTAWVNELQQGAVVGEVGEVVWAPADVLANTSSLTAVPPVGTPFNLGTEVELILAPATGANGGYWLEDCNRDGLIDIAMRDGLVQMDFRAVSARVRALDVSVFNRSDSFAGELRLQDPGKADMAGQVLTAAQNEGEILSLRTEEPFHYADLTLTDGCFLGFSLTPPTANGSPGAPRAAVTTDTPTFSGRPAANGTLVAWPVGANGYDVEMRIDNETADWDELAAQVEGQGDGGWYPLDTIVFDANCISVTPSTATDLFGRVRFAYDEDYLYAAFLVDDDFYKVYTGADEAFFLGDSPQLLLDLDLNGDLNDNKNSPDDIQLDFHPGLRRAAAANIPPQVALWRLHTSPPTSSVLRQASVTGLPRQGPNGPGYLLETAVPWAALGVKPQPGQAYGLAASVSDDDTEAGNDQECMVSSAPNRDWRDPTTWGTLLLAPLP